MVIFNYCNRKQKSKESQSIHPSCPLFEGWNHHDRKDKDKTGQGEEGGEEERRCGRAHWRGEGGRNDCLPPVWDWTEGGDDIHQGKKLETLPATDETQLIVKLVAISNYSWVTNCIGNQRGRYVIKDNYFVSEIPWMVSNNLESRFNCELRRDCHSPSRSQIKLSNLSPRKNRTNFPICYYVINKAG